MTETNRISVIIPCLNEATNLTELLPILTNEGKGRLLEIIVSDGGSEDKSVAIAKLNGATIVHSPICCRATQLNLGAKKAKGDILYFLHADTRPIEGFAEVIHSSLGEGKRVGCFRYRFDNETKLLQVNSWFTKFNSILSGGGDQSLFIEKTFFNELNGFDESFHIMEDFELVRRIRQKSDFHVLPYTMTVSARKYRENGWLKVQLANFTAFSLFLLKVKPASIKSLYLKFLSRKN
ncbi:TIGR04283 family arsenosugar biosynthesis glycosyltransferase [Algoriphagus winogradskyi]|uniref:Transferase 2, rSAM/selenodomain-associated n=1 Tax=Algoriphagus winogradskyi TaxID=237017 RepID=A0ABY1P5T0_9BACT|nr:TIGR04283 family arsenosugar biosynthesis glycosyltransferase [Algoriphagus winogradskyi]SMP25650.1 transferase 2, rSAM/selenodomain-associated [Algoriphagus winogradskyi]